MEILSKLEQSVTIDVPSKERVRAPSLKEDSRSLSFNTADSAKWLPADKFFASVAYLTGQPQPT